MSPPTLALIPLRPAVRSDFTTGLDVLIKITSPRSCPESMRPAVNLGLVLDNSRSMDGHKIDYARRAAAFTVNQLLATDRVSVTTFNSAVRTIVPNVQVTNRKAIVSQIEGVETEGKTALHPGWVEGRRQVLTHLIPDGINRVLLLSDGLANLGLTDADAIADEVRELASQGVGTTTMGVGEDFNEDLMEAMARAGGGNYYYIASPDQLPVIFQAELEDMMMTVGYRVTLEVEARNGVTVSRVLNDFELNGSGQQMLPNVVAGKTIGVVVRLNVPPREAETEVCRVRMEWDAPRRIERPSLRSAMTSFLPSGKTRAPTSTGKPERQSLCVPLTLPAVASKEWRALDVDPDVREQAYLLLAALAKREAVRALTNGDVPRARNLLEKSRLSASSIVPTPAIDQELEDIASIEADLERGELEKVHKRAKQQSWARLSSSSILPSPLLDGD